MSKHDTLSKAEAEGYRPHQEILRYIAGGREVDWATLKGLKILDWGCGRGRLVAFLIRQGMDAYGVDVDPEAVENGKAYLTGMQDEADRRLGLIDSSGGVDFPDGFFDVIVSDNVLEHVPDLDQVLSEISRLTKPGGRGFHLFPARFTLFEGHLFMPLVHWLPKNTLRRYAIQCFTRLGIEPKWPELDDRTLAQKADDYFEYSCRKTYYRSPGQILDSCTQQGLAGKLVAIDHPRMSKFAKMLGRGNNPLRRLANRLVSELKTMEVFLEKSSRGTHCLNKSDQ